MPDALHRLEVPVTSERREVVSAWLLSAGSHGVWEQRDAVVGWFTDDPRGAWSGTGPPELADGALRWLPEPDRDWQADWKATIRPVRAGRTVVVPSWLAAEHREESGELTLVLDPGRAFGSGHHATTVLCLELLDELDLAGRLSGRSVTDVGCGSGILALAAAARGAAVTAVDIDPDAVEVTLANAAANGLQVDAAARSVGEVDGTSEVVVANLISDLVRDHADRLVAATGHTLIVSGITVERRDDVLTALVDAGATLDEVREQDGWIAARLTRSTGGDRRRAERGTTGAGPGRGPLARMVIGALGAMLLLAACTTPEVTDTTVTDEEEDAAPAELGADAQSLVAELEAARGLVEELLDDLAVAAEADELTGLRELVTAVDGRLVASPDGGSLALFPVEPAERTEDRASEDVLTALVTAGREVGGDLGRSTVEALRDPIAGDLGAWELDAPGVVASARDAAVDAPDIETATDAVLALDGEGPRAIAWVTLAGASDDLELARLAAERATDHLEVIDIALRGVLERSGGVGADEAEEELGPTLDDDPASP